MDLPPDHEEEKDTNFLLEDGAVGCTRNLHPTVCNRAARQKSVQIQDPIKNIRIHIYPSFTGLGMSCVWSVSQYTQELLSG